MTKNPNGQSRIDHHSKIQKEHLSFQHIVSRSRDLSDQDEHLRAAAVRDENRHT